MTTNDYPFTLPENPPKNRDELQDLIDCGLDAASWPVTAEQAGHFQDLEDYLDTVRIAKGSMTFEEALKATRLIKETRKKVWGSITEMIPHSGEWAMTYDDDEKVVKVNIRHYAQEFRTNPLEDLLKQITGGEMPKFLGSLGGDEQIPCDDPNCGNPLCEEARRNIGGLASGDDKTKH